MKRYQKILISVLILGGLLCLAYFQFMNWHNKKLEKATNMEKEKWMEDNYRLEEMVVKLQDELRKQETFIPEEKLLETFGEKPTLPSINNREVKCNELERQIYAVFSYLDKKDYISAYNLTGGTHEWFKRSINKLSRRRPVVSGETNNLYSLIKNTGHFYRILGNKGIRIVKDILVHESDILEPLSALFYEWFINADRCKHNLKIHPSSKTMYEYAGFFLNTLAGRSYMLRRDSKVQILASYYSVLIIQLANERHKNEYGIDIRLYTDMLLGNISNHKGLTYQNIYLEKLAELAEKHKIE